MKITSPIDNELAINTEVSPPTWSLTVTKQDSTVVPVITNRPTLERGILLAQAIASALTGEPLCPCLTEHNNLAIGVLKELRYPEGIFKS